MSTPQVRVWRGEFGRGYTDRSPKRAAELDAHYGEQFGLSRTELNERCIGHLDRNISILEIGCNVGVQLDVLRGMGFTNLTGIDLELPMVRHADANIDGARFAQADLFHLPFPDESFDLVCTSGVLIHIDDTDLDGAITAIHRCARRYIWGWEYYSDRRKEITYRGQSNFLWKDDFPGAYRRQFPKLETVYEERVPYLRDENEDVMFLFDKGGNA